MPIDWAFRGGLAAALLVIAWAQWQLATLQAQPTYRRNDEHGIRTSATQASDQAWRAAHKRAERPVKIGASISATGALFMALPMSIIQMVIVASVWLIIALAVVAFGRHLGHKEALKVIADTEDHP